jgi:sulfur carrier protein ThiS
MPSCRISTVGQEHRDIEFTDGQTIGSLFEANGIDIPDGVEVWVNGEEVTSWSTRQLENNDAIVLMPNLKGARKRVFRVHRVR